MAFHLAAFKATVAAAASYADLSLANDQHFTMSASGKAIMPYSARLKAMYALGATLSAGRLYAPSLRDIVYPELHPIDLVAAVPDLPAIIIPEPGFEPRVVAGEEVNFQTSNSAGGATDAQAAFGWFESRPESAPPGVVHTLRLSATITTSAYAWVSGTMTPSDTLPSGKYAVVGMHCFGTGMLAARLVPTEGGPRPGVLAQATVGLDPWPWFRYGRMGKFLEFYNTSLPNLEVFNSGANSAQTVFLDIVRLG